MDRKNFKEGAKSMKRALLHVDYTFDFVADQGALTAGQPAQDVFENVMTVTKEFAQNDDDFLVFGIDTHHENDSYHPETKLFPPHNLEGSRGIQLYDGLEDYYQSIKDQDNVYYMPKTRYSAFAGTDLHQKLSERGIKEVHILGVCTDICVLHTAIDAYNLGYQIVIYQDSVASFNQAGHDWALHHFTTCLGATVK